MTDARATGRRTCGCPGGEPAHAARRVVLTGGPGAGKTAVPSAARGYDRSNPVRIETAEEAAGVDDRIARAWDGHPHRHFVASAETFLEKLRASLGVLEALVPACCRRHFDDIERSRGVRDARTGP